MKSLLAGAGLLALLTAGLAHATPYSYASVTENGSTNIVTVPFPYINQSDVTVSVGGTPTTAFTWLTAGSLQLTASAASLAGVVVTVQRHTAISSPDITFQSGSLDPNDLNTDTLQELYATQEVADEIPLFIATGGIAPGAPTSILNVQNTWPAPQLFGGGTPLTFSVNPPLVAGATQFIPPGITTTALPALVVERSTNFSVYAGNTSPTLFVGTKVNVTNSAAFVDGIDGELEVTANTGAGGGSIESIRGRCILDSGVLNIGCWGGSFVAVANGSGTSAKGVESEASNLVVAAPVPSAIVIGNLNASFFASSGLNGDGGKVIDAGFMINPFSLDGFQAGFECPTENSAGTVVRYACFEGAETATFGIDLSLGHWANASINAPNFFVTQAGVTSATQLLLSTAGNSFISANNANGGAGSNVDIQGFNGTTNVTALVALASGGVQTPNLPTSAGSGGLYDCVDSTGVHYKKASCP